MSTSDQKLKSLLLGVVAPIVVLVIGVGTFFLLKRPEPPKRAELGDNVPALLQVLPIAEVEKVRALAELSDSLNLPVTGTVVPYRELQLAAEVQGRIVEKDPKVRSGNYVSKGQVLYRIDPADYKLDIERLTRRLEQEQASLQELDQEIKNSERLMEVVEEQLKLADIDVKRLESLGEKFSSAAELDAARRSRLTAMNQKVTVQNQLSASRTRRGRLELAIKTAETELQQANLDLERTVVESPVDGRIVNEQVEIDSYVQRGSLMVVIEDTEKVEVLATLRMDQLYWILDQKAVSADELVNPVQASRYELPDTPVTVRFTAGNRENTVYQWQGRLDRYDGGGLDAQSRLVPVRIVVDNPSEYSAVGDTSAETVGESGPPLLVRGMFVDAVVQTRPATPLVLVPELAIKPATMSYQAWKFSPEAEAIYFSKQALREKAQREEAAKMDPDKSEEPPAEASKDSDIENAGSDPQEEELPDPDEWDAGFLQVVDDVRVIGTFVNGSGQSLIDGVTYSICEVSDGLEPGDSVIVTPLPGINGNGKDAVRVAKSHSAERVTTKGAEKSVAAKKD